MATKEALYKDVSTGESDSVSIVVLDETTTPANAANIAKLYAKDVGGVSKVHALDSAGVELELGSGGGGGAHAADHLLGGGDEIDGDQLDIDFTPANYTPSVAPPEASDANHLTAHLAGIDDALLAGGLAATTPKHSDNRFSPVARYELNGTLGDASGGGNPLAVDVGTENYSGMCHVRGDKSGSFIDSLRLKTAANDPALTITGAITMMVWIAPQSVTAQQYLFTFASVASAAEADNTLWSMRLSGNRIEVFHEYGVGSNVILDNGSDVLIPNELQHLAVTRSSDGLTYTFYVNGAEVGTAVTANAPTGGSNSVLWVGESQVGTLPYTGLMWDLVVVDSELSGVQIKTEYLRQIGSVEDLTLSSAKHSNNDLGPVARYELNNSLVDGSGNSNDLTVSTGTEQYSGDSHVAGDAAFGAVGTEFLTAGAVAAAQLTGAVSAMSWVKIGSASTNYIVGVNGPGETSAENTLWSLYVTNTGQIQVFHEHGSGTDVLLTTHAYLVVPGQVANIAFTRSADGLTYKIFVNGALVDTLVAGTAPDGGGSSTLNVGGFSTSVERAFASIWDVVVFDKQLTDQEVKDEYLRQAGLPITIPAPPEKLTPIQITADQNDYTADGLLSNITTAVILDIDAARTITGFSSAGMSDGKEITFINNAAFTLTLAHQNAGSAVGNRLNIPGASNLNLTQHQSARFMWDTDLNAWRSI